MNSSREGFEAWAASEGIDISTIEDGWHFQQLMTETLWEGWSARDSEVERLREALKPFAEFGEPAIWCGTMWDGREEDSQVMHSHATGKSVTLGDFLRAARVLSSQVKESGNG